MKLTLDNIGILKHAEVRLDALTIIAGENDSGKSTVGKVLYALIKTIRLASNVQSSQDRKRIYIKKFNEYIKKLFNNQITESGVIAFEYKGAEFVVKIEKHRAISFSSPESFKNTEPKVTSPLLIDSPYIWQVLPSLKTISTIEKDQLLGSDIDFEIPETLKDLYAAFSLKLKEGGADLASIKTTIGGEFIETQLGDFVFKTNEQNIQLANTAMGIKYLGILQVLAKNHHLYSGQILILDEPEVHLHPNWQLKLAQWIIELAQKGIKVLVNSHSPYIIEALQRYSERSGLLGETQFYMAENGQILQNDQALSQIFAKLSEPFSVFDQMDSEALNG